MKFVVSREVLLKPLQSIISVVEKKQTMPILGNLLITVGESTLTLKATDLELELICTVPLIGSEEGAFTTPAKKFHDIVKSLPEGADLELVSEDNKVVVRSGRSRFTLISLAADAFPSMDGQVGQVKITCAQKMLRSLLSHSAFAMAQQDVRYFLNGLLLEVSEKLLRAVATDGHRLAMSTEHIKEGHPGTTQVIVPRKAILELIRILEERDDELTLLLGSNYLRVVLPNLTFTTKLLEGRYPDYHRVVPTPGKNVLLTSRDTFRQALVRTAILSNEKFRGIRLKLLQNLMKLEANNPEQEEAQDEIEVAYVGEEIEIGFNVNYLLDALSAVEGSEIKMAFINATSSALMQDPAAPQHLYVVMPIRL